MTPAKKEEGDAGEETGGEQRSFELRTGEPLSVAVVRATADVLERHPLSLPETLHEAVDPDALDRLWEQRAAARGTTSVQFTFCDCLVTVHPEGPVRVRERPV